MNVYSIIVTEFCLNSSVVTATQILGTLEWFNELNGV